MNETTRAQHDTITLLQDYTAALAHAYAAGDTDRQARLIATMNQALHIAGLHLPMENTCADITYTLNGYTGGHSLIH